MVVAGGAYEIEQRIVLFLHLLCDRLKLSQRFSRQGREHRGWGVVACSGLIHEGLGEA